jgi:hypothetical protein
VPYYIDWQDFINPIVKERVLTNIIEKYKLETNNLYYFYKYWRLYCPANETRPSDFVRFLKEQIDIIDKHDNIPKYIDEFISHIGFEIEISRDKNKKRLILENYDNSEYFNEQLERHLELNAKRYLSIEIEEDD